MRPIHHHDHAHHERLEPQHPQGSEPRSAHDAADAETPAQHEAHHHPHHLGRHEGHGHPCRREHAAMHAHDGSRRGHVGAGTAPRAAEDGAGRGGPRGMRGRGRPTLEHGIVRAARRIRRADLDGAELHRRLSGAVSHADYVTTMRTLRAVGVALRD